MHLQIKRPSLESSIRLCTILAVLALMGCEGMERAQRLELAGQAIKAGNAGAALAMMLPPPFNVLAAATVLVGGHLAATVVRPGPRPTAGKKST